MSEDPDETRSVDPFATPRAEPTDTPSGAPSAGSGYGPPTSYPNPYPSSSPDPYAPPAAPSYGAPSYGPQPYGAQPYGAQPYGAQPYGAQPSGPPSYGAYPPPQPYPGQPAPYPPYARTAPTNGMAIASMVLGILWLYWVGSILALIFGYIAKRQIRERGEGGGGMATAGIVLGWIGVGVLLIVLAVALVAGITDA